MTCPRVGGANLRSPSTSSRAELAGCFKRPGVRKSSSLFNSHYLRELLEPGFEVAMVKDATAGARHPELGDGYQVALSNFGYLANDVMTTEDVIRAMRD